MNTTEQSPAPGTPADDEGLLALAEEFGIRLIHSMAEVTLDPALVSGLPVEWARARHILPVRVEGRLCALAADPSDVGSQEYLSLLIGEHTEPVLASASLVGRCIEECYYKKDDSPTEFLRDMDASTAADEVRIVAGSADLLQVAEKAPVTQLVNLVLLEALKRGASDVHFESGENCLRVRYRIDGVLYEQAAPPKRIEDALVSRLKVMAHMDIAEKRLPQDGTARVRVGEREIDIRVSTVPVTDGERVVLRLLDRESVLLTLSELGMAERTHGAYSDLLKEPNGVIVVSGPTGSGKTTTLYASLGELDAAHRNIMTVEEPVEYRLPGIGQIQVNPKIGLTFAQGLRHILRQDPDIVLVGETRDFETAEIAIRASLTGHLVFTTLHTNDAASSVLRLVDMGIEPYLLASCLRGVLAQRLVRRLCVECRREGAASEEDLAGLGDDADTIAGKPVWMAVGCDACLEGYRGRSGLFELIALDPDMARCVRGGESGAAELRSEAGARGMPTLLDDGLAKVLAGTTSLAEVMTVVG